LLGLGDEPASVNAYLALIGVVGLVGWGLTTAVIYLVTVDIRLMGWTGTVLLGWAALTGGRLVLGGLNVPRAESLSAPFLVWLVLIVGAFAANVYGATVATGDLAGLLMGAPWLVAMTLGYLVTGLLVTRGGVYLAAGAVGVALVAALVAVGPLPAFPVILGLLHAVPMFVDAARGGRELTSSGRPRVAAERGDPLSVTFDS
jgi:hypothetical protein